MSDFQQQAQEVYASALARLREGDEMRLQQGPNPVRILPRFDAEGKRNVCFWEEVTVHWGVGPKGNRMVRCLRPLGKRCFICDHINQLASAGRKEEADRMSASQRFYMAVIPLNRTPTEVKILSCGSTVLEGILLYATNKDWGSPDDPVNGYPITITKTGEGQYGTKYTVQASPQRQSLDQGWLNSLPDLSTHVQVFSYEQQQMIVAGQNPNEQQFQGQVPLQAPQVPQAQAPQAPQAPQAQAPPAVPDIGAPAVPTGEDE